MTNPHDKAIEAAAEALLAAEWEDAGETPEDAAMIARSIMGGIADDSDDYARVARLAARAAIAAYERAMWRPIEEAPKDGAASVIVGRPAIPCWVGVLPAYSCEAFWSDDHGAFVFVSEYLGVEVAHEPTHFRPLPPVPEGE